MDFFDRTEPPTPKRLDEARKKGVVAKSRELTVAVVLLFSTLFFLFYSKYIFFRLGEMTIGIWTHLNFNYNDIEIVSYWFQYGLRDIAKLLFIPLAGIFVIAILINVLQSGFFVAWYQIKPNWSRINPFNGSNFFKFFSLRTLFRIVLTQINISVMLYICWKFLEKNLFYLDPIRSLKGESLLLSIFHEVILMGIILSSVYLFFGLIDLAFQKWNYLQELKMTPREIKEEIRQVEGNIHWKSKIQSLMHQQLENRLINTIPRADVILVSLPNHVIALKYDSKRMLAPICLAKGISNKAHVITNIAKKFHVPIVENSVLTHSLFKEMKEGSALPPQYYYEVAKILSKVKT